MIFCPFKNMADLCNEDIQEKLEPLIYAIGVKIKQLTRELANTGSKKLKLMKQLESLSIIEENIQQQLKGEMDNEKRLRDWMNERTERLKLSFDSTAKDYEYFVDYPAEGEHLHLQSAELKSESGVSEETLLDMRCTSNNDYLSSTEQDLETITLVPTVKPSRVLSPVNNRRPSRQSKRKKTLAKSK